MSALGLFVGGITSAALVALFLLSVRYQFYSAHQVRQWPLPPLRLLRQIRLFAPKPVRTDYHVMARDFRRDGVPSSCREIPLIQTRHWTHAFWNPGKRRSLPLIVIVGEITEISTALGEDRAAIILTIQYLTLLGIVSRHAAADAVACQFLLVERFGYVPDFDTLAIFCSAVHRVDRCEVGGAPHLSRS